MAAFCRYSSVALDILLVDDDRDFADVLADSLREQEHLVCIARDGASALALASELRPDVVLLDLGLPDVDGYEVARSLRRVVPDATPIIVISGRRHMHLVEEIDLMLTKPVQSELFGGLIEYVRRRRQTSRPLGSSR